MNTNPQTDRREQIRRALAEADGFTYEGLEPHDYQRHADAILALPAVSAVVPPTQDTLRDRIAEALYRHSHPGWATRYADLGRDERDTYLGRADAVLAVLPPLADRPAVLRWAADAVQNHPGPHRDELQPEAPGFWWDTRDRDAAADLLRRLAAETQQTETETRCPHGCDTTHCPCLACEAEKPANEAEQAAVSAGVQTDEEA